MVIRSRSPSILGAGFAGANGLVALAGQGSRSPPSCHLRKSPNPFRRRAVGIEKPGAVEMIADRSGMVGIVGAGQGHGGSRCAETEQAGQSAEFEERASVHCR
jgi:hypothetical protein